MTGTRGNWLPRLLTRLNLAAAALLAALVFLSPLLDNANPRPRGWERVVAAFAREAAVRRTALASAIGLCVTACVFFQPPRAPRRAEGPLPPDGVIGA